jgi:hypothetical protein
MTKMDGGERVSDGIMSKQTRCPSEHEHGRKGLADNILPAPLVRAKITLTFFDSH